MLVIMKGLLSGYNIDPSTIHEAQNAEVLCLFENPAYLELFLYNMPFYHSTSTMAAAGPAHGKLVSDMVNQ